MNFLKSYVDAEAAEKKVRRAVSVHKLHHIVQSIEFYWLNSPLNQLQILLSNARSDENQQQSTASSAASGWCINKDLREPPSDLALARACFSELIYRNFLNLFICLT